MADARKTEKVVRSSVFELILSEDEADALAVVLALISGDMDSGIRKFTQPVLNALEGSGTDFFGSPLRQQVKGSLSSLDQ